MSRPLARLHRRFVALAVALALSIVALAAQAQRVAVVRPDDGDAELVEGFNRLNAELRLDDFEVAVVWAPPDLHAPGALAEVARRAGALAGVVFVRREGRSAVDVWIDEHVSGRPIARTLESAGGSELPNVLAIRAADLLRTSLREFASRPPPPPEPAPVPHAAPVDTAHVPAPPRPRLWEIRAEGLMLWDGATLGAAYGAALGFSRRLSDALAIGILVSGPLGGANWDASHGSAFLRQEIAWADARLSWWRSPRLDFGTGIAAGVHYLKAQGAAKAPLMSQSDQVWSFAAVLGAHGNFQLTSSAAIGVSLRAIALAPKVGVGVGSERAVLQWPMLSASAGLLVGF